jgi:hypothetical protein
VSRMCAAMTETDNGIPLRCEKCGAMNKPGAKPTLTIEPNGTVSCSACAHNFPLPVVK